MITVLRLWSYEFKDFLITNCFSLIIIRCSRLHFFLTQQFKTKVANSNLISVDWHRKLLHKSKFFATSFRRISHRHEKTIYLLINCTVITQRRQEVSAKFFIWLTHIPRHTVDTPKPRVNYIVVLRNVIKSKWNRSNHGQHIVVASTTGAWLHPWNVRRFQKCGRYFILILTCFYFLSTFSRAFQRTSSRILRLSPQVFDEIFDTFFSRCNSIHSLFCISFTIIEISLIS